MSKHSDQEYLRAQSYVGHINALRFRKETEAKTDAERASYAVSIDSLMLMLSEQGFTIYRNRMGDFYLEIEDEDEDEDEDLDDLE